MLIRRQEHSTQARHMPHIEQLIMMYGPAVIFVGTFLEGETILVMAGFLSHQGSLNPYGVAVSAFLGSFMGDQLLFYIGRRHASHPFVVRISRRPIFEKIMTLIADHPKKFTLSFRFIYGIRTISPIALGLTNIKIRDFLVLNAIAAAIWASAFTALGYVFGKAFENFLGEIKAVEQKVLIAIAIALVVFSAYHIGMYLRRRFSTKPAATRPL